MKNRERSSSYLYGLQVIIYRALLDVCFYQYIDNVFTASNYGKYYSRGTYSFAIYLASWILTIGSVILSKRHYYSKNNSSVILLVLYLIVFIPFTTMFGFNTLHLGFVISNIVYWIIIWLAAKYILNRTPVKLLKKSNNNFIFLSLIVLISIISVIGFGRASNFRISFDISSAYVYRLEAIGGYGSGLSSAYILGLSRIVIPCGIVYSIKRHKYGLVALFGFSALISYGFDGSKTIFLLSLLSIVIALFYKKNSKKYIPLGMILINLIGYINFKISSTPIVYQLLIRRLCFVPTLLNDAFYDYMLSHSPNYFSNLLRIFGYRDFYDIAYVIGNNYFGSSLMSANTGTVGDALWQLGYIGLLIMPLLIILLLRFFDNCTIDAPEEVTILPCVIYAYYLNNSSFTTACFTHGLVMFCLIMATYSENDRKTRKIRFTFGGHRLL